MKVDRYLFDAETLTRSDMIEVEKLRAAIAEAKAFFASSNLLSLSRWTSDPRSGAPFLIEYEVRYPARLQLKRRGKSWKVLTIPSHLLG